MSRSRYAVTMFVVLLVSSTSGCEDDSARKSSVVASARRDAGVGGDATVSDGTASDAARDSGPDGRRVDARPDSGAAADADASKRPPDAPRDARADGAMGDGVVFGPREELDPGGLARSIGTEFSVTTFPNTLRTSPEGRSWLLWTSLASPDVTQSTVHLDHFDVDGERIGSSPLEAFEPYGFVLHESGMLTAWKSHCRETGETCLYQDRAGTVTERLWSPPAERVTNWRVDWNGDVVDSIDVDVQTGGVVSGAATGDGLYGLTLKGQKTALHGFDDNAASIWSVDVLPSVLPPALPPDAPIEDIIRATILTEQAMSSVVATDDGVVVAAVVTRATLAALARSAQVVLPLPDDPLCGDVIVVRLSADGRSIRYFSVPTPECESLPVLTVVAGHAVVTAWIPVPIPPQPNDTSQYDISLAIVELATGDTTRTTIGMAEDDIVQAVAPCGAGGACLAGTTGARSVDTGSTVSYGDGFILPVSLDGTLGTRWNLRSQRHTTIPLLAPRSDGSVLFFGTIDGPITHTGDVDPSLRYDRGLLGVVTP